MTSAAGALYLAREQQALKAAAPIVREEKRDAATAPPCEFLSVESLLAVMRFCEGRSA